MRTIPVLISAATPADIEQIRAVQREVWLATYPNEAHGITIEAIQAQFADKGKTSQWISQVKQALITSESSGWIAKYKKSLSDYIATHPLV